MDRTRMIVSTFILVFVGVGAQRATEESGDARAVRATFAAYKTAILARKGTESAGLVSGATLRHFGRLNNLALRGSEREVRKLPFIDKFIVLRLRHQVPVATMKGLDDRSAFAYGVTRGWIGEESVRSSDIGKIAVAGQSARAQHIAGGQITPMSYNFVRESGRWKFDLMAIMPIGEKSIQAVIKQQGVSADRFLLDILQRVSGESVSPAIWRPLQK